MNQPDRIYLDNAATSWPKRDCVLQAVNQYLIECGATAGRGTYASARQADQILSEARSRLANLIGCSDARNIAFASSGTHALNAALCGLIRPGDHVVTSQIEHNSVLRPLELMRRRLPIEIDYIRCDPTGLLDLTDARRLLRSTTRLLIIGHASNVTGRIQPLAQLHRLAHEADVPLLVDASQTLGYAPIDLRQTPISGLVAAGHKGLGGIAGTGFLCIDKRLQQEFIPWMTGGSGLHSESLEPASTWPQSVEVGNLNLPGIVSMSAAAHDLVKQQDLTPIPWQHVWRTLLDRLVEGLNRIDAVSILGHDSTDLSQQPAYVPVVSIKLKGWSASDLATVLDDQFGIEVRSGFHCAALVHDPLGTTGDGGTLRISLGHSTTISQIDALLEALSSIASHSL